MLVRACYVIVHLCTYEEGQVYFQGFCPSMHIVKPEQYALFHGDNVTPQSFAQGKGVVCETKMVEGTMITARVHLVEIQS